MRTPSRYLVLGAGRTGGHLPHFFPEDTQLDIVTSTNPITDDALHNAAAAIVFLPTVVMQDMIDTLIDARIPAVIGTTAVRWPRDLNQRLVDARTPWILGSNFSLGMNLLVSIASFLGDTLRTAPEAFANTTLDIHEVHHTHKQDKPSGSAVTLHDALGSLDTPVPITAERTGDVAGRHTLNLNLPHETLSLTHDVRDRSVFAQGAAWAAQHLLPELEPGLHHFQQQLQNHLRNQRHDTA
ncbi:dihydrodipicolinate reductase C-terminal domain-containing protein [Mucisphaera calidilacus]|uniref:4-hydroxy-tetrahydrodipicolinate reductase n=1 Tax=Mucisphaera calidilacus TaxID=2527982 RepID=A0A518BXV0_9BACT|nr:dihydrodipicolinate reductase C-terminal domain-containing protein [Mucisphaera calidilacus]QDU71803.1 4-hydroxy-tetrahydrodipicolinate reductase [Mucisphaera calidilacus]